MTNEERLQAIQDADDQVFSEIKNVVKSALSGKMRENSLTNLVEPGLSAVHAAVLAVAGGAGLNDKDALKPMAAAASKCLSDVVTLLRYLRVASPELDGALDLLSIAYEEDEKDDEWDKAVAEASDTDKETANYLTKAALDVVLDLCKMRSDLTNEKEWLFGQDGKNIPISDIVEHAMALEKLKLTYAAAGAEARSWDDVADTAKNAVATIAAYGYYLSNLLYKELIRNFTQDDNISGFLEYTNTVVKKTGPDINKKGETS